MMGLEAEVSLYAAITGIRAETSLVRVVIELRTSSKAREVRVAVVRLRRVVRRRVRRVVRCIFDFGGRLELGFWF